MLAERRRFATAVMRQTILITHANPEDNVVARWLATRLIMAGYKVWLDLRSLRGGQDFWDEIENQLRLHAIKQIVLLSPDVRKPGVKKELALGDIVGKQLGDSEFMIPIRVRPISHSDFPPELLRRNALDADPHWSACLAPLLETLTDAKVPQTTTDQSELLAAIVAAQQAGGQVIKQEPETLLTNWFDITERPVLRMFGAKGIDSQLEAWLATTNIPAIRHSGLVATFCDPATFVSAGVTGPTLDQRFELSFDSLVRGRNDTPFVNRSDARHNIVNLLRQHWDLTMKRRGLSRFEFSAGKVGWFFPDQLIPGRVKAEITSTIAVDRALSGKFKERRWHLCLVATPRVWPAPLFRVHANIALSENGQDALPGQATHLVRRRLTRSWWNDKWRDVLLAGMHWLADGKPTLSIAAGTEAFELAIVPTQLELAVSYSADELRASEESSEGEISLSEDLEDGSEDDWLGEDDEANDA